MPSIANNTALSQQLIQNQLSQNQQNRNPRATDLIEQAKQVEQDEITLGASETSLANQEPPRPVKASERAAPELLQTRTTLESINRRLEQNFEALSGRQPGGDKGQLVDVRA